ncbi:MAG: hypothetical protein JKY65_16170 [Planctomycetes bacterium]|nr:hypothetical protein [Planctomycetota bacterium]
MSEGAEPSPPPETPPPASGPRWWVFMKESYEPLMHFGFVLLWFGGLAGTLHLVWGVPWRLDLNVVSAVVCMFFVLFFIRVVDEVKDEDYDRLFSPDRPLIRGAVDHTDLRRYALVTGLLALLCCALPALRLSPWLLAIVFLDLAHTLLLVKLDQWSETIREGMLANLVVTYPVNVLVSGFIYLFALRACERAPVLSDALVVGAFVVVFLHFELGRKLQWPEVLAEGERAYTREIPPVLGALLVVLLAAGPAFGYLWVCQPWAREGVAAWLPWSVLSVPALALFMSVSFLKKRGERVKLKGWGSLGITLFYLVLLATALLGGDLEFAL